MGGHENGEHHVVALSEARAVEEEIQRSYASGS